MWFELFIFHFHFFIIITDFCVANDVTKNNECMEAIILFAICLLEYLLLEIVEVAEENRSIYD